MSASPRRYGDRYEITGRIASGGMAEVFTAHDQLLDRTVALKILHEHFSRDKAFIERFRREARSAAGLSDARIVSIYDWGIDSGTYYIVMEYVDGKTLREIISNDGPLTPERSIEIASDVCGALHVAHRKGLVHRDVKPANIAVTKDGQTKVMDFGIARAAADDGQTVTQTGTIIGTANYFSPEQAQGHAVDHRSDVYSIGVVLYEMLTQQVPFTADTPIAIAYKHVKEDPTPPSVLNPEISPALDAVVIKALAKNPDNRYETADEMRADLQRLLRGDSVLATPLMPTDKTVLLSSPNAGAGASKAKRGIAYALIFALFLSILTLGIVLLFSLFGQGGATVAVPNVVNKDQIEAERILKGAGLQAEVSRSAFSETFAEGLVVSQDPEDGRKVAEGSTVQLVISKGAERVSVPDLHGKSRDDAIKLLQDAGLAVGAEQKQFSDEVPEGTVIDQDPRQGTNVDRGSTVDIVLSGGTQTVRVPNVEGLDEQSARERLLDAGLTPAVKETCKTQERHDIVLKQDPPPRTEVKEGSTVTLTINKAPPIPNVVGMTRKAATDKLIAAGFVVDVTEVDVPGNRDEVIAQDKPPGDPGCKGDKVTITVET
ncbi:MAG: PASTA domain-containing protein [Actinomycetota bacterium]